MAGVTTGQIYYGAIPYVIIQVVMIGVVIGFPQLVMHYKGAPIDPATIEFKLPTLPTLGAPSGTGGLGGGIGGAPKLGAPVINP